jgi:hypothetical protein
MSRKRFDLRRLGLTSAILATGVAFSLIPGLAAAAVAPPQIAVGKNIQVSSDAFPNNQSPGTEVEPMIAVNPTNANDMIEVFQEGRYYDGGSVDDGYATSTDGGKTWTSNPMPGVTTAVGGKFDRASDPSVAFAANGNAYMASLVLIGATGVGVTVNASTDGGMTWSKPVIAYENDAGFSDKSWITVDTGASSPRKGTIYITWDNFYNNLQVELTKSTDGGKTWSTSAVPNAFGEGTQPLVQPNGDLTVTYEGFTAGSYQAITSTDGGSTWGSPVNVGPIDGTSAPNLRSPMLPYSTIDPTTGTLYVAWQSEHFRVSQNDIVVSSSTDGGKTWSPEMLATTDPKTDGVDHFTPGIVAAHGGVAVTYDVQQEVPSPTGNILVYYSQSANGGKTWSAPTRVSSQASNTANMVLTNQGPMLGDYQGIAGGAAGLHAAFILALKPNSPPALNEAAYTAGISPK